MFVSPGPMFIEKFVEFFTYFVRLGMTFDWEARRARDVLRLVELWWCSI